MLRSFRTWTTCIYLMLILSIYLLISISQKNAAFLDALDHPYSSFSRVFERDLLMADFRSLRDFSWYDRLYSYIETDLKSNLEEGIASGEEILKWIEKESLTGSRTLLRLRVKMAVFYAEAGNMAEFVSQTRKLESGKPEAVQALITAYFKAPPAENPALAQKISKWIGNKPSKEWSFGQLRARYLKETGKVKDHEDQTHTLNKTGKGLRLRYSFMWICFLILLLSGLSIALLCLFPKFRPVRLQNACIPLPVSSKVLAGVLARSAFWGIAVMYGTQFIPVKCIRDLSFMSLSFLSALPMIYYVQKYLIGPLNRGWAEVFGLSFGRMDIWKMIYIGLLLAFVDQIGSGLINAFFQGAGRALHWSEAVDEILIFGKPWEAGMDFFDSVVSAPLFEEIACRGLLYATLRKHLNALSSVLVSGVFFSAIHFYSMAGFFEVLWSGIVWAYAYEKTRSLGPGIFSHALNNFLICLSTMLLYR
jgi:membrane protease YdiL (CAAX protease family)